MESIATPQRARSQRRPTIFSVGTTAFFALTYVAMWHITGYSGVAFMVSIGSGFAALLVALVAMLIGFVIGLPFDNPLRGAYTGAAVTAFAFGVFFFIVALFMLPIVLPLFGIFP